MADTPSAPQPTSEGSSRNVASQNSPQSGSASQNTQEESSSVPVQESTSSVPEATWTWRQLEAEARAAAAAAAGAEGVETAEEVPAVPAVTEAATLPAPLGGSPPGSPSGSSSEPLNLPTERWGVLNEAAALKVQKWLVFFFLLMFFQWVYGRRLVGWVYYGVEWFKAVRGIESITEKCHYILQEQNMWERTRHDVDWYRRVTCEGDRDGRVMRDWLWFAEGGVIAWTGWSLLSNGGWRDPGTLFEVFKDHFIFKVPGFLWRVFKAITKAIIKSVLSTAMFQFKTVGAFLWFFWHKTSPQGDFFNIFSPLWTLLVWIVITFQSGAKGMHQYVIAKEKPNAFYLLFGSIMALNAAVDLIRALDKDTWGTIFSPSSWTSNGTIAFFFNIAWRRLGSFRWISIPGWFRPGRDIFMGVIGLVLYNSFMSFWMIAARVQGRKRFKNVTTVSFLKDLWGYLLWGLTEVYKRIPSMPRIPGLPAPRFPDLLHSRVPEYISGYLQPIANATSLFVRDRSGSAWQAMKGVQFQFGIPNISFDKGIKGFILRWFFLEWFIAGAPIILHALLMRAMDRYQMPRGWSFLTLPPLLYPIILTKSFNATRNPGIDGGTLIKPQGLPFKRLLPRIFMATSVSALLIVFPYSSWAIQASRNSASKVPFFRALLLETIELFARNRKRSVFFPYILLTIVLFIAHQSRCKNWSLGMSDDDDEPCPPPKIRGDGGGEGGEGDGGGGGGRGDGEDGEDGGVRIYGYNRREGGPDGSGEDGFPPGLVDRGIFMSAEADGILVPDSDMPRLPDALGRAIRDQRYINLGYIPFIDFNPVTPEDTRLPSAIANAIRQRYPGRYYRNENDISVAEEQERRWIELGYIPYIDFDPVLAEGTLLRGAGEETEYLGRPPPNHDPGPMVDRSQRIYENLLRLNNRDYEWNRALDLQPPPGFPIQPSTSAALADQDLINTGLFPYRDFEPSSAEGTLLPSGIVLNRQNVATSPYIEDRTPSSTQPRSPTRVERDQTYINNGFRPYIDFVPELPEGTRLPSGYVLTRPDGAPGDDPRPNLNAGAEAPAPAVDDESESAGVGLDRITLRSRVRHLEQHIKQLGETEQEAMQCNIEGASLGSEQNQRSGEASERIGGDPHLKEERAQSREPSAFSNILQTWLGRFGMVDSGWTDQKIRTIMESHTDEVKIALNRFHQDEIAELQQQFSDQLTRERENAARKLKAAEERYQELQVQNLTPEAVGEQDKQNNECGAVNKEQENEDTTGEYEELREDYEIEDDEEPLEEPLKEQRELAYLRNCLGRISMTVLAIARNQGINIPEGSIPNCEDIIHMLEVYNDVRKEFLALYRSVVDSLQLLGQEPPQELPVAELISSYVIEWVDLIRIAEEQAQNEGVGQGRSKLIDELQGRIRALERTITNLQAERKAPLARQSTTEPTARAWTTSSTARRDFSNDQDFVECFTIGEIARLHNHLERLHQQIQTGTEIERYLSTKWAAVNTKVIIELKDELEKRNRPATSQPIQPPPAQQQPITPTFQHPSQSPRSTSHPSQSFSNEHTSTTLRISSQPSATPFAQIDPSSSPQTFNDQFSRKYGPFQPERQETFQKTETQGRVTEENPAQQNTTQEAVARGNQNDDLTSEPVLVPSNPASGDEEEL
ncbi:hypothetical protein HYALB_00000791 [Hymenoscyphus albidus]|uniref:Uncharacterized protein n=1 Tax=Hymenoscyphus albidus TaxID=595503 RepID=A0A9N9LRI5_9HELO|nr:hypothetical protein HYALB_00000791 [Hymenoscyphus albidus]